ncbi:hypothetical protein LG634_21490 [Streptomyces bambusae]|uniref:hypothetical protein n=1 Tax=Streptomyces bambusae TaxID=1550616 RepID=UPI001CFC8C61|nr:hypothetical protein [Streptomyces bambusae]MCB5167398.1 hypothetical protein [Streptomyces bambusae]
MPAKRIRSALTGAALALGVLAATASPAGAAGPPTTYGNLCYQAHVQNLGWLNWQCDGQWAGTKGKALNLEVLRIHINGYWTGCFRAHRSNYGWDNSLQCAEHGRDIMIGTTGMNTAIEAVEFYAPADRRAGGRAHVRNIGDVAGSHPGGDMSHVVVGTEGRALPIEQLYLVIQ